jgi:hypothetical protein
MPPQPRVPPARRDGHPAHVEPPAPHLRAALLSRDGGRRREPRPAPRCARRSPTTAPICTRAGRAGLAALRRASAEAMRPVAARAGGVRWTAARSRRRCWTPCASTRTPRCPRPCASCPPRHPPVVVSNWDVSLHERLDETGLAPLLDGAVASAEIAAPSPTRPSSPAGWRSPGGGGGGLARGRLARGGRRRRPRRRADGGARRPRRSARAPGAMRITALDGLLSLLDG